MIQSIPGRYSGCDESDFLENPDMTRDGYICLVFIIL